MSSTKVKILMVGAVGEHFAVLQKKLESLQSSKAGPFDVCFCVGPVQVPETVPDLPLPVYLQEYTTGSTTSDDSNKIVSLGNNLFYLQGDKTNEKSVQILEIKLANHSSHPLIVGCCSRHVRAGTAATTATKTTTTTTTDKDAPTRTPTQQCDLLLSSDWPQGMEDVVNVDTEPLSFDVAQVALECRPRYHVAPSSVQYHASPPYELPNSNNHVGRFLALAPVTTSKPTKTTKFIHALGLVPLAANPPATTAPSTLPCPFLPTSSSASQSQSKSKSKPPEYAMAAIGESQGYSMFATSNNNNNNSKRSRRNGEDDDDNHGNSLAPPDDPSINTLFLYGLHKDVTGELQSTASSKVLQAFGKHGISKVRHPPNTPTSTYCFLEFPDQAKALECLLECHGRITIDNVSLTLKWASQSRKKQKSEHDPQRHYVTQAEAPNSTTLYFHPPPKTEASTATTTATTTTATATTTTTTATTEEQPHEPNEGFATALCNYLQTTLEDALNEGNDEDGAERITAETEPALKIRVRTKDHVYGFLEFASHAAATMALAAVTKSTDGGLLVEEPESAAKPPSELVGTTLRWAKGEPKQSAREQVLEALGLQRQYFPADTRTDCWFCLSSPTCETHLITGVYNEWYATLPKGPVHPGHVLLVPVTHTRNGAWTQSDTSEWTQLVEKLQQHAAQTYECDLLVFERAMATKGGYHTHINCVPIPRDSTTKLQTTMMAHAKASGFELRNVQSDLGMNTMISDEDSYFYAEVRTQRQTHRFLYKHDSDVGGAASTVPLQFAREVLASVLQNPKLAHWKSCVVDKEQETQLTKDFRESFTAMMS
jgi:diadenosine tetraphosphate (Ap4A) HIT family hydrolase